ncbi:MAG: hypothetical protein ACUZ8E_00090 [Candidatus Anammoxibacter sp.]
MLGLYIKNKKTGIYYYDFILHGERYHKSTRSENKKLALEIAEIKFYSIYQKKYDVANVNRVLVGDFVRHHMKVNPSSVEHDENKQRTYDRFVAWLAVKGVRYLDEIGLTATRCG